MVPCLLFPFSLWGNEAKYSLTPSRLSSDKGWLANFEEFFSLGQKLLYYGACLRWWARNMPLPRLTTGVKIWLKVFLTNQCNKRPLQWIYICKIKKNGEKFLDFWFYSIWAKGCWELLKKEISWMGTKWSYPGATLPFLVPKGPF